MLVLQLELPFGARAVRLLRPQRKQTRAAGRTDREAVVLETLQTERDPKKRQALTERLIAVGEWTKQIGAVARRWRTDQITQDELVQAGVAGLLVAAERWRPGPGWASFAHLWIEYQISEAVRRAGHVVLESQREIRQRRKTKADPRPRTWAPLDLRTQDHEPNPEEQLLRAEDERRPLWQRAALSRGWWRDDR